MAPFRFHLFLPLPVHNVNTKTVQVRIASKYGVVEYWSDGGKEAFYTSNTPTLHYSNNPSFLEKMTHPYCAGKEEGAVEMVNLPCGNEFLTCGNSKISCGNH